MNTIRAIIFDLDGVICFTDQYHYQAWKEMADAEGIYFDETINGRLRFAGEIFIVIDPTPGGQPPGAGADPVDLFLLRLMT